MTRKEIKSKFFSSIDKTPLKLNVNDYAGNSKVAMLFNEDFLVEVSLYIAEFPLTENDIDKIISLISHVLELSKVSNDFPGDTVIPRSMTMISTAISGYMSSFDNFSLPSSKRFIDLCIGISKKAYRAAQPPSIPGDPHISGMVIGPDGKAMDLDSNEIPLFIKNMISGLELPGMKKTVNEDKELSKELTNILNNFKRRLEEKEDN